MPAIKAVIFDCFGVLVGDGLAITREELARDPSKMALFQQAVDGANSGRITGEQSKAMIADILGITTEQLGRRTGASMAHNVHLLSFIRSLRPDYTTALLSNVARSSLEKRFSRQELDEHFDQVFRSCELGMVKPDPAIYRYALNSLGVEPTEAIFVDDNPDYVAAAQAIGMHGIIFRSTDQTIADVEQLLKKQP